MIKIKDYLKKQEEAGLTKLEIADSLGITRAMVSAYSHHKHISSIRLAKQVFKLDGTTLFPYSTEALIELIKEDTE